MCVSAAERFGEVRLIVAQGPDEYLYRLLLERIPEEHRTKMRIVNPSSLPEVEREISEAGGVVGERLHVNVLAMQMARPLVALAYASKVRSFIESAAPETPLRELDEIGPGIMDDLDKPIDRDERRRALDRLARQAWEAFDGAIESALAVKPHDIGTRTVALLYLLGIHTLTLVWSVLVLGKRAIFGRGAIRKRKGQAVGGPKLSPRDL